MAVSIDIDGCTPNSDIAVTSPVQELEAATGFSSYIAYVNLHELELFDAEHLSIYLRNLPTGESKSGSNELYRTSTSHCFVMDVPRKRELATKFAVRLSLALGPDSLDKDYHSEFRRLRHARAQELFQALKSPIEDHKIRVITWYTYKEYDLASEWVDVIGLLLQVPPSFFEVIYDQLLPESEQKGLRFSHPQHLVIGNTVATFVRRNGSIAPTILIVHIHENIPFSERALKIKKLLENDDDGILPFAFPHFHEKPVHAGRHHLYFNELFLQYQDSLRDSLEQDSDTNVGISDNSSFFTALLPLLKQATSNVQFRYRSARRTLLELRAVTQSTKKDKNKMNLQYELLDQERFRLRRTIEDYEDARKFFHSYVVSEGSVEWLEQRPYQTARAYSDLTTQIAQRLEVEIRDYMQIVVGALSIDESRKSIELTNVQIEEGKQIKIFTILAFIYVPLNLATSIFGMNLQQLNAEGQPLWIFAITAVLALTLTGTVWVCIIQVNSVKRWRRTGKMQDSSEPTTSGVRLRKWRPDYTVAVRLTMLYYLVRWGNTKWMFRSRIWFHILRNSSQRVLHPDAAALRYTKDEHKVAAHFVSSLIQDKIPFDDSFEDARWYWTLNQSVRQATSWAEE